MSATGKHDAANLRAVIYCRISLDASGEGLGVARQEEECRTLCQRNGWSVVDVKVDNSVSASTGKVRPQWSEVLAMIERREVDVVVAWQVDRMYRTIRDLEDLVELTEGTGVVLATVSGELNLTTANGRMMARILGSTARGEVEMKSERQKRAHAARSQAGRPWWNSRPFGFERNGDHREDEAAELRRAYTDALQGASVYSIAQRWNREGVLTPKGNQWRSANLRHVLVQPRNAAIVTYNGVETGAEATWEPIVSEDVYRAVCRMLAEPSRRNGGGGRRKALLTGIATCSKCSGKVLQGVSKANAAGERYRTYTCREGRCITIPADFLNSLVLRKVIDHVDEWSHLLDSPADTTPGEDNAEVAALRSKELTLRQQRQGADDLNKSRLLDEEAHAAAVARIDGQLAEIEDALATIATSRVGVDVADLESLWERLDQAMEEDVDKVRSIIQSVTASITLLPRQRGAHRPKASDVDIRFRKQQPVALEA
jgi:site-specific DNA recombinase